MGYNIEANQSIRTRRRARVTFGLNTIVAIALATVLFAMVNYLSYRHYARMDWSKTRFYALSDKTVRLLEGLSNRVDVVVFFQPDHEAYEDVDNLLKEYESASRMVRIERVDPNRDPARAEQISTQYDVQDMNVVVFSCDGRSMYTGVDEIVEMDYSGMLQGGEARKVAFRGEQAFSSAILSITQERRPIVYFLRGHGERDLESRDPYDGYSTLKQQVSRDNVDVRTFAIGESKGVPADADAIVIAGPKKRFAQSELDALRSYLEKEGRLLVLLDANTTTGLEDLLSEWGIEAGVGMIIDPTRTLSGSDLFVTDYGNHPITRHLAGITTLFYLPRAMTPEAKGEDVDLADKPQVIPLGFSSAASWGETEPEQKPIRFDKDRDLPGPMSIAAASERGPIRELGVDIRSTRVVAFGDSDFVANSPVTGGNYDFFLSSLNWLLEREALMEIAPKPVAEVRLLMDSKQLQLLFWSVVVGLPGIVATLGILVSLKRRA